MYQVGTTPHDFRCSHYFFHCFSLFFSIFSSFQVLLFFIIFQYHNNSSLFFSLFYIVFIIFFHYLSLFVSLIFMISSGMPTSSVYLVHTCMYLYVHVCTMLWYGTYINRHKPVVQGSYFLP